jgi:hypothetical protein
MLRTRAVLAAAILGVLLMAVPAYAQYPPATAEATVAVSRTVVAAGGTITVTGEGFQPGSQVTVSLVGVVQVLGTTTARADGTFSVDVTIPRNVRPGRYILRVSGTGADGQPRTVDTSITVAAAAAAPGLARAAGAEAPGRLAMTGGQFTTTGATAALFLVVGGGALFASRRLRKTAA